MLKYLKELFNIFPEPDVQLNGQELMLKGYGEQNTLHLSDLISVSYAYDMGVGFSDSIIFNHRSENELSIDGSYGHKTKLLEILHNHLDGFPKIDDLDRYIDDVLICSVEDIWRKASKS